MESLKSPLFPPEMQNGCKLMSLHRVHRLGAWHLMEASNTGSQGSDCSVENLRDRYGQDVACLCAHLNNQLAGVRLASQHLPVTEETLFAKLRDGVVACALANAIKPGLIEDDGVTVSRNPMMENQIRRNWNLAITALEICGVSLSGLTVSCFMRADSALYVCTLLQALRRCLLPTSADETALVHWVGSQLGSSGASVTASDLPATLGGPSAYARLLFAALPDSENIPAGMSTLDEILKAETDPIRAGQMVAQNAACLGLGGLIMPEHFVPKSDSSSYDAAMQRKNYLCLLFLARLYRRKVSALPVPAEINSSDEEESVKMWINSLGVEPLVDRIDVDLRSGLILLQVWEVLSPRSVNWSSVSLSNVVVYESEQSSRSEETAAWLANCVHAVECARMHGIAIEMSVAEGLAAGDKLTTLALTLSMMRHHSMMQLKRATDCDISSPVSVAADVIGWANRQMTNLGTNFHLSGVDDPNLKATNALGYLGERVLARTGRLVSTVALSAGPVPLGLGAASVRVVSSSTSRNPAVVTPSLPFQVQKLFNSSAAKAGDKKAAKGKAAPGKKAPVVNDAAEKTLGKKTAAGKKAPGGKAVKNIAPPVNEDGEETWEEADEASAPVAKSPAKGAKTKAAKGSKKASVLVTEENWEEADESPAVKTPAKGAKTKAPAAKSAKGSKKTAAPITEENWEEADEAPVVKTPAKGAKTKTPGAKSAKGGKAAKTAAAPVEENWEEADEAPVVKTTAKTKTPGAKSAKGNKTAKMAAAPVEENWEEADEAPVVKTPATGAKTKTPGAKSAKGAKGGKAAKTVAAPAEENWEETDEAPVVKSLAKGAKTKTPGAKSAKGGKAAKTAAAPVEENWEEADEAPVVKTPAKTKIPGAKSAKSGKAAKTVAAAVEENWEEADEAPVVKTPAKTKTPGAKSAKGGKAAKMAAVPVTEENLEEAEEAPVVKSPAKAKTPGAKGAKGAKAAPVTEENLEDAEEAPVAKSPAKGAKAKTPGAKGAKGAVKAPEDKSPAKGSKAKAPGAKGAKGGKAALAEEQGWEEADEAPVAMSPNKGAKAKTPGAKGAKGGNAAKKAAVPAAEESLEDANEAYAPATKSPVKGAKAKTPTANGIKAGKAPAGKAGKAVKAAKAAKAPSRVVEYTEEEVEGVMEAVGEEDAPEGLLEVEEVGDESEAAAVNGKTPGAKGAKKSAKDAKKGVKDAKKGPAKDAKKAAGKAGKVVKAAPPPPEEELPEEGYEADGEILEKEAAPSPVAKKCPLKAAKAKAGVKKGAKTRLVNDNAVTQAINSNAANTNTEYPKMLFQCVTPLTSVMSSEYSRLTLALFRQCGLTIFADKLGPETDTAVYMDVLMQLKSASFLDEKAQ